jgi:hypothetical protein
MSIGIEESASLFLMLDVAARKAWWVDEILEPIGLCNPSNSEASGFWLKSLEVLLWIILLCSIWGLRLSQIQGWFKASDALNLSSGFKTRHYLIKSINAKSSVWITCSSLLLSGILKIPYSSSSIKNGE